VKVFSLAALLSTQNIIEDENISYDDKMEALLRGEDVLQGLLEHAQHSNESTETRQEQWGKWSSSVFENFWDHIPSIQEFYTWLNDNPPPREIPTRSIDAFLCKFFQDTKDMQTI
jgi:hypothetical protein